MNAFVEKIVCSNLGDKQRNTNDCAVSVVKTLYNLKKININRNQIKASLTLDEEGVSFQSVKSHLVANGFDCDYIALGTQSNPLAQLADRTPLIAMVTAGLRKHFILIKSIYKNHALVMDPANGEFRNWSLETLEAKLTHSTSKVNEDILIAHTRQYIQERLDSYGLTVDVSLKANCIETYNKLGYFDWFAKQHGFHDTQDEKAFLGSLIEADEKKVLPSHFRKLRYINDATNIKTPVLLTVDLENYIQPDGVVEDKQHSSVIARLFGIILRSKKSSWLLSSFMMVGFLAAMMTYIAVYANQILIDEIFPKRHILTLYSFAFVLFIFRFGEFFLNVLKTASQIFMDQILDKYFYQTFSRQLLFSNEEYIRTYSKGDLAQRVNDILKVKQLVSKFINDVLLSSVIVVFSIGMLFFYNATLALIVFGIGALYLVVFRYASSVVRNLESTLFTEKGKLLNTLLDKVEGHSIIRRCQSETFFMDEDAVITESYLRVQQKARFTGFFLSYFPRFISVIGSIAMVMVAGRLLINDNALSLGQVLAVIGLAEITFSAMRTLLSAQLMLQESIVVVERFFDFCGAEPVSAPKVGQRKSISRIDIRDLHYQFPNQKFALNIDRIAFHQGETVYVDGANGCGKSTMLSLIGGSLQPTEPHTIQYVDPDGGFVSEPDARKSVLLTRPEDKIFNNTLNFNIYLGRDTRNFDIYSLAKKIGADDFICPSQLHVDALISDGGSNLSAGQRRKILLLRAIVSDCSVLIFDEIFRGVDKASKEKICHFFNEFDNRTLIFTSHEPIDQLRVDRVISMAGGRVIDDTASHDQTIICEEAV
ncbi:hypothetical protein GCM10008090_20090 [Arenicella chitinivorans]|uniref:ATP-binding cassette domain-containing protein n=1 Tax=Arenicella chitinivorans TaxID=1329800 RepID=A0A918RVI0_9GAMM|nr:ABC transporter transmembrane domain-containing protein [Arenicella chitinivorans]GHA10461.1 hypothetical protein GCM10008090_20090 [Arenicella chitinivorans]